MKRSASRVPHRGPTQGTHTEDPHRGPTQRGGPHRGPTTGGEGSHRGPTQNTHRHICINRVNPRHVSLILNPKTQAGTHKLLIRNNAIYVPDVDAATCTIYGAISGYGCVNYTSTQVYIYLYVNEYKFIYGATSGYGFYTSTQVYIYIYLCKRV